MKATLYFAIVVIGLGCFGPFGRRHPAWLKATGLALLALLIHAGPLWKFSHQGPNLFEPSRGFGSGTGATLYRGACLLTASLPNGLFFGVPAFGVLAERVAGRGWTWTGWMAASFSFITGFLDVILTRLWIFDPSTGWFNGGRWPAWMGAVERLMVLAWYPAVGLASRWVFIRSGPAWDRRIGGPDDQPRGSTSAAPPASNNF